MGREKEKNGCPNPGVDEEKVGLGKPLFGWTKLGVEDEEDDESRHWKPFNDLERLRVK